MSSPHLGSRRPESGGIIKKTWRFLVHGVVRMLYSQTGKELLYEEPNLETKDQLLYQLSDPSTSNDSATSSKNLPRFFKDVTPHVGSS